MAKKRPATLALVTALLVVVGLIAGACNGGAAPVPQATPTTPSLKIQVASPEAAPTIENSLRIAEPLPGSVISGPVTVRGSGRAFENTILVEVRANDIMLGREIVTTQADTGQIGEFTTTVQIQPVVSLTDATVVIYTTSAMGGSVDQRAEVAIKLAPVPAQTVTSQPTIRLSPNAGKAGTVVVVMGENFPAGGNVEVRLSRPQTAATEQVYAAAAAGKQGAISVTFTMPEWWPNGDLIVEPQLLVVASTPDLVHKAAATFYYGVSGSVDVDASGASTSVQAANDFLLAWTAGQDSRAIAYLDADLRDSVQSAGNVQSGIARLMGVQTMPRSTGVQPLSDEPEMSVVRVSLVFEQGTSHTDLAMEQTAGKWTIKGIKPVAFAP
jgi:hypothetical protein